MYCEISLNHSFFDAEKYRNFLREIEIIIPLSRTDGINESRLYQSRSVTTHSGIIDAGRIDGLLVLFINYGESSAWHIEGSLNDNSRLFETAKKVAERILKKRKAFKDNKLRVDRLTFFEEGLQKIRIVGKVQGWKEAWKESKERQNLVPTIIQSILTGSLLYLTLGVAWVKTDEPVKMGVSVAVAVVSILLRLPAVYFSRKNKVIYAYGED